jgi:OPA family glycerol-3-phosphate transporter-like MFS transporter
MLEHPEGFRARRGVNWVFLGLMYGFFYMSRYNLSAISVAIGEKFGWSNADYGGIVSAGVLVYGISVFLNGPLADKIGGKRAILIGSVGAAAFNFLFGLCHLFLLKPAVWADGKVVEPATFSHGMTATTLLATFSTLWACNHYFQSFGALSIVKINAAWFHVRERGSFAGIFGIMIQSGRTFAFFFSPFILAYLPWQYCFWIPAAILTVMFFLNREFVANSPADAGFEYHTADETKEEEAQKATLGFVLRKVFASRAAWLIAFSSMCIGMVRNSIDHWWARYIGTVFHIKAADLSHFLPYQVASWGMPLAAIAGGLAAGNASDRIFGARRAPVIFFAFCGQAVCLLAMWRNLHSAWMGCLVLLAISFFIQSAHSLVGGAASMDFGGKKAVATAAGLFDGAQYLAATLVGYGMGRLLDHFKDKAMPGAEYDVWPLAPIPFALIGAFLISRLWNVVPGRGGHGK